MFKTYIFDLDGTLVNSLYDLADSMNSVLEKHNFPVFETDKYRYFVGNGTMKLVERTIPESERTEEKISSYHSEFSEEYNKRCVNKTKPYDGIVGVLETLESEGCKIAVASNKPDSFAKFIVNSVFEEGIFDLVVGKKDNVPTKPSPEIIYEIIDRLSADKESTVLVGDSDVDVKTAENSGIKCIGCDWGFRGREELEKAGADFIAVKPEDILDY